MQTSIPCFVDFAEAALAETGAQFVVLGATGAGNGVRQAGRIGKCGSRHDRKNVMSGNIIAVRQLYGSSFAVRSTTNFETLPTFGGDTRKVPLSRWSRRKALLH
jgi:hypothetical protein